MTSAAIAANAIGPESVIPDVALPGVVAFEADFVSLTVVCPRLEEALLRSDWIAKSPLMRSMTL